MNYKVGRTGSGAEAVFTEAAVRFADTSMSRRNDRRRQDKPRPLAILMLAFLAGCMAPDRIPYGPKAASAASVEGFGDIRMHADSSGRLPEGRAWLPVLRHKEVNYLVLSGGGAGGAFSVGALKAWSDKGERPEFDIVSGVSTGALIAPYAFLGPAYDKALVDLYTSGVAQELVDMRFLPRGCWAQVSSMRDPYGKWSNGI